MSHLRKVPEKLAKFFRGYFLARPADRKVYNIRWEYNIEMLYCEFVFWANKNACLLACKFWSEIVSRAFNINGVYP